jgi:hypothetical protein
MSKCLNKVCIEKCKEKYNRKRATGPKIGEQHLNTVIGSTNNPPFEMCDNELVYQDEYAGYDYTGQQFTQSKFEECNKEDCHGNDRGYVFTNRDKEVGGMSILLDSQSTHSTFCSKKLLTNIRNVPSTLRMFSNGGEIMYRQHGDLKNYRTVWY